MPRSTSPRSVRLVAALAVAASLATLGACGDKDADSDADSGGVSGKVADATACAPSYDATAQALPTDLPAPARTHAYSYLTQGKTQVWFTSVPGSSSDLVSARDAAMSALAAAGYKKTSSDQEPGAEADLGFSGPHDGTAQFRPLCQGRIRVRWTLTK